MHEIALTVQFIAFGSVFSVKYLLHTHPSCRKKKAKKCFINLQLLSIYWQHVAATSFSLKPFRRPKNKETQVVVGRRCGKVQEVKTKGLWPKFVCQPWAENMTKTILACLYTFIFSARASVLPHRCFCLNLCEKCEQFTTEIALCAFGWLVVYAINARFLKASIATTTPRNLLVPGDLELLWTKLWMECNTNRWFLFKKNICLILKQAKLIIMEINNRIELLLQVLLTHK